MRESDVWCVVWEREDKNEKDAVAGISAFHNHKLLLK